MNDEKPYAAAVSAHYGRPHLQEEILQALEQAGRSLSSYRDTMSFDQFHIRGAEATRELARLSGIAKGQALLDLGCGIGGASRLLAAEFGCHATGIDLMTEFIQTATALTTQVGLSDSVVFQQADMLSLPFAEHTFDVAWSQHTLMNIADKSRLLAQVRRVLKPGGLLVLYEIAQGPVTPVHYPVQWASDPSINFLLPATALVHLITAAGFDRLHWQDMTEACLQWFQAVVAKMKTRVQGAAPPIGLNLVIGPTTAEKARNTVRNLAEDRIHVFYGVFKKAGA
ncbi:MAG: methyltransferase type 11 [Desulfatitalea sp. BRH_c12]|nr:MAG: methyltransferase type 11 [Desulfatitalea sp. BRH_c12]